MAIVSVTEDWSEEGWDDEANGSRAYRTGYRVQSDDPNELAVTVRMAPGIPALGSVNEGDAAAFVTNRSAKRSADSRLLWDVVVTWQYQQNDPEENPLNEPVKIRWTSTLYRKPVVKDKNGNAIVNSAGDFFDPPPEKDYTLWIANIQYNAAVVPVGIRSYSGAANAGSITVDGDSIAAERARISGLDISEEQIRNDIIYRTVTLALECLDDEDPDGFDLSLLDQGYRINDGGVLKDILIPPESGDGEDQRPSAPVLLNGSGAKLSNPGPTTAVFLDFEITKFSDLTVFPGID